MWAAAPTVMETEAVTLDEAAIRLAMWPIAAWRNGRGVAVSFLKDTLTLAFNILELTGPHRPGQQPHHAQGQQH